MRHRGTMLGLAVGDALGLEVEGDSPGDIRARFPQGVRDIPMHERERPWDDDLAQAVVLAEALLEGGSLDVDDLVRTRKHPPTLAGQDPRRRPSGPAR